MTYGTYLGKNGFNKQTEDLEKGNNQYLAKTSAKEHGDTSRLEKVAEKFLENLYNLAFRGGVHGVPGDAKTPRGKIACSALIPIFLGAGVHCAAAHTGNTTDIDYVGDYTTITIRGNVSDVSPDPYECLFADDGNLSKIGPGLALAAMVAEYESELQIAEQKAAKNINLGGEHKLPIDISEYADVDWSEVLEWDGKLHWPNSSRGRAEKGKVYIPILIPLTDAEESYYRDIYDGPKKPGDNRIFDDEIAIK